MEYNIIVTLLLIAFIGDSIFSYLQIKILKKIIKELKK